MQVSSAGGRLYLAACSGALAQRSCQKVTGGAAAKAAGAIDRVLLVIDAYYCLTEDALRTQPVVCGRYKGVQGRGP